MRTTVQIGAHCAARKLTPRSLKMSTSAMRVSPEVLVWVCVHGAQHTHTRRHRHTERGGELDGRIDLKRVRCGGVVETAACLFL